jgi:hypothetical protein
VCGVGASVAPLTRTPAIDTHPYEKTTRDPTGEEAAQGQRVDLAITGRSVSTTERLTSAVIDVLEVEKDDDAPRPHHDQRSDPEGPKKSPAGSE